MKAMRKVTKVEEPTFILNYTNCETPDDLRYNLIIAKVRGGQSITEDDLNFVVNDAVCSSMVNTCAVVTTCYNFDRKIEEPKKPWYKRFWHWLTGRK